MAFHYQLTEDVGRHHPWQGRPKHPPQDILEWTTSYFRWPRWAEGFGGLTTKGSLAVIIIITASTKEGREEGPWRCYIRRLRGGRPCKANTPGLLSCCASPPWHPLSGLPKRPAELSQAPHTRHSYKNRPSPVSTPLDYRKITCLEQRETHKWDFLFMLA